MIPTKPGLYQATLGTIETRMTVEVWAMQDGVLRCSIFGSEEMFGLGDFTNWSGPYTLTLVSAHSLQT